MKSKGINVKGVRVDEHTRCKHYSTDRDIIAIKFKCCYTYYPCYKCHEELADHAPVVWRKEERLTRAILCGACQRELTIALYMSCNSTCPYCQSRFNEGCQRHYHLYFEM